MMPLQTLATVAVASAGPSSAAGVDAQEDAGNFAGALDSAATGKPAAALATAIQGFGQRSRKAPGDAASSETDRGGTDEDRARGPAEPQAAAATVAMPLDIAILAQMAAAMVAPAPVIAGGSAAPAPAPASGSSATPGPTGKTSPGLALASLLNDAGSGTPLAAQGPAAAAVAPVPKTAPATAQKGAAGTEGKSGSDALSAKATAVSAAVQALVPSDAETTAATTAVPAVVPQAAGPRPPSPEPVARGASVARPVVPRTATASGPGARAGGTDGPGTERNVGVKTGTTPGDAAAPVSASDLTSAIPPSPAQQVVTALQSLAPRPSESSSQASAAPAVPTLPAIVSTSGGIKTVTIQLNPGHLGPVSVTLRMKADTVDIQIAVSNPEALHLLDRDRHALAAAVEALGGNGTSLRLDAVAPASEGGTGANAFAGSDGSSRQQQASSDAASTGRGNQNRSGSPNANQNDADDTQTSAPPVTSTRSRDGSLYL